MKQWTKAIEINAPIEQVWGFLNGSLENMQQIMPNVVENKPVKITEEVVGSKRLKVGFTLANMFEITAFYELHKISEDKTSFQYTVTNKPLKWFVKLFLVFASDKVVVEFLERVKNVAEGKTSNDFM
jgi:ligand-binding SRPBCC domain-containing protein